MEFTKRSGALYGGVFFFLKGGVRGGKGHGVGPERAVADFSFRLFFLFFLLCFLLCCLLWFLGLSWGHLGAILVPTWPQVGAKLGHFWRFFSDQVGILS